jgi:hypothetical protein
VIVYEVVYPFIVHRFVAVFVVFCFIAFRCTTRNP